MLDRDGDDVVVRVGDGRELEVSVSGDPNGFSVVVHHGTPGSRVLLPRWVQDAAARGIRLISYNRPGYGGSTPHTGRAIADAAADVARIADELGVERFASWGVSGGGPHALACAALLADRVTAVATIASAAPFDAEGLDFLAGMGDDNVVEFRAAAEDPGRLESLLAEWRPALLGGDAESVVAALRTVLSSVDERVLSDEIGDYMVAAIAESLARGIEGWRDDDLAFVRPWGFRVEEITVPVLLWQGAQDLMVPFRHGEWLADKIAGVDARLEREEGHLTLQVHRVADTHAWLLEHSRDR